MLACEQEAYHESGQSTLLTSSFVAADLPLYNLFGAPLPHLTLLVFCRDGLLVGGFCVVDSLAFTAEAL
jgi:hypothetical protein